MPAAKSDVSPTIRMTASVYFRLEKVGLLTQKPSVAMGLYEAETDNYCRAPSLKLRLQPEIPKKLNHQYGDKPVRWRTSRATVEFRFGQ